MSFKLRYNYFIMLSDMFLKSLIATIVFGSFYLAIFHDFFRPGRCNIKNETVKDIIGCVGGVVIVLLLLVPIICPILDLVQDFFESSPPGFRKSR